MISILIEGRLRGNPVQRATANGDKFVTAQVRARAADGTSILVSVIAFAGATREAIAGLTSGDALTVTGQASLIAWIGRDGEGRAGLKMTATKILTIYQADGRHGADNLAAPRAVSRWRRVLASALIPLRLMQPAYIHKGNGVEHGN